MSGNGLAYSPWSTEQLKALKRALVLEPCHVTGMHDPNHTSWYLCDIQKSALVEKILAALDLTPADLPHQLHDDCAWCHSVPGQEEYRMKLRRLWDWAGVEHPPELAATASDGYFPGDEDTLRLLLGDESTPWAQIWKTLGWEPKRASLAMTKLADAGHAEWIRVSNAETVVRRMRPYDLGERVYIYRRLSEVDGNGRKRETTRGHQQRATVLAAPMPQLLVKFLDGNEEVQLLPVSWVESRIDQEFG